jgi:hypothetical protein
MTVPVPREVIELMASREHRLHHWLWHEVRNSWLSYPEDVQQKVRDVGWEPPRPALDERRRPILDNDAGEDFLFMHRQMLVDVSRMLARIQDPNYPRVLVWTKLPPPGDPVFPVPPPWFDPERGDEVDRRTFFETIQRLKSDIFYEKRLVWWQQLFTDPAFLRDVTLGQLGTLIEQSIHASMHNRWSAAPAGFRPDPGPDQGHTIDPLWDDPRYDHLADTYASHVNPVFWSLHGWVDDRVEDWKAANDVYGNSFWKGTWVGKMPRVGQPPPEQPPEEAPAEQPPEEAPADELELQPAAGGRPVALSEHGLRHAHGSRVAEHRAVARTQVLGREHPQAAPPGAHALMGHSHHGAGDREEMEELVKVIGQCGIFYEGYSRVVTDIL